MIAWLLSHVALIVGIITGVYELIARLIPTVGNYSLLHLIIELLKWISDHLNISKKK
jgi:uncharacterized membrane-anchored protein YhcB (DUF1043 family)